MSDQQKAEGHAVTPKTKEQELTQGLKDTFPASDPVQLESKTVAAKKPKLVGVEEVLKQKADAETQDNGDAKEPVITPAAGGSR